MYVLPLERIELIYSNSCTVNHCGGIVHRSASAITPFGRNSSKHGVCYYFQGFHMYIWDVRRKINPLLLGFRNVFIKNPESSWYHRSCFENGSTTWMFKEHLRISFCNFRVKSWLCSIHLIKMPPWWSETKHRSKSYRYIK